MTSLFLQTNIYSVAAAACKMQLVTLSLSLLRLSFLVRRRDFCCVYAVRLQNIWAV